jgi:glycine hydroxymethyltransferase
MRAAEQDSGIGFVNDEAQAAVVAAEGIIDEASGNDVGGVFGQAWSDDRVAHLLERLASDFVLDNTYREQHLSLTASENYPSKLVRMLGSGLQGGFYEFAPLYPTEAGEWAFPDSGGNASLVGKLTGIGRQLFEAAAFDWRPNGGSVAEQAVLLGTCGRGDGFVHFAHKDGGHFALETLAAAAGVNTYRLPMVDRTLLIDVDRLATLCAEHPEIKLVILDLSFKLRWQPLAQIRAALPGGVFLAYDASHDGALIAGGALP